jgi:pimeloyl-ACP methyl ester carboxylesterase
LKTLVAIAAASALVTACAAANTSQSARSFSLDGHAMTACKVTGALGDVVAAICGTLTVPENRADPNGRKVALYVALIPAKDSTGLSEPVFFIAGGPGDSSVWQWAAAGKWFPGLNDHHDIVLVDQRGTGKSHQLVIPYPTPIPGESPADYAARQLAAIDGDLRYYTTAVAVDDLDAVRQALGYRKIDLYGGSYGATAVQYYLRQHPDHAGAAVLDGGTLLDVPVFELMAKNSQRSLDDVLARCVADAGCSAAYPGVRDEFAAVMSRLDQHDVATGLKDSNGQPIVVTADTFASTVHVLMQLSESAKVPWFIHQAWSGNWAAVVGELQPSLGSGQPLVMAVAILCSEAWARDDPGEVKALGAGSYLLANRLVFAETYANACQYAPRGYVPPNDAQPVSTNVPVLLIDGSNDPQDPPSNVAASSQQMPNSLVLTAPGQGHVVGYMGCLPKVIVKFFDAGKIDATAGNACIASMQPPSFQLG